MHFADDLAAQERALLAPHQDGDVLNESRHPVELGEHQGVGEDRLGIRPRIRADEVLLLHRGLDDRSAGRATPYVCPAFATGSPLRPLDKALVLADALEDEEVARELTLRK